MDWDEYVKQVGARKSRFLVHRLRLIRLKYHLLKITEMVKDVIEEMIYWEKPITVYSFRKRLLQEVHGLRIVDALAATCSSNAIDTVYE